MNRLLVGHALTRLRELPDASVHCVVTSIPYWGLRDYGTEPVIWGGGDAMCEHEFGTEIVVSDTRSEARSTLEGRGNLRAGRDWDPTRGESKVGRDYDVSRGQFCARCGAWRGQLGLEPTPQMFVGHIVEVFHEVRRVLRKDGTLWLNVGDTYAGSWGAQGGPSNLSLPPSAVYSEKSPSRSPKAFGLKPKDRCMIPARVAIALQDDGWWLRDEIIWHKPNPMPSSVTDRTTPAHEMIYLLTKSRKYWYDADAIRTPFAESSVVRLSQEGLEQQVGSTRANAGGKTNGNMKAVGHLPSARKSKNSALDVQPGATQRTGVSVNENWNAAEEAGTLKSGANRRSVWTIATQAFKEAHFATFPEELPRLCILAGCPEGGTVLDPFAGSGTTGAVAESLGRDSILIEINPEYAKLIEKRMASVTPALRFGEGCKQ